MAGSFGLAYSTKALAFLESVKDKKLRKQIIGKVKGLATTPRPRGCVALKGIEDDGERVYRIRSGDYRILYVIRGNPHQIVVLDIDHRKDVYR